MSQFSMIDVNDVSLTGRLTRDPELRYTASGTAVLTLRIACGRKFRTKSGETKEDTLFIDVVVWDRTAENCAQYLSKGRPVHVTGRLQSRSWEKDGQKRTTIEVVGNRIQFMDFVSTEGGQGGESASVASAGKDDAPPPPDDDDIPF